MQLELRHLRYFLAVAEELNFSRAAERLHIAQPALSAQIRSLETQLGCKLFNRTTRKVELTPAGELLLADARNIVARTDRAAAKVAAAGRGEQGGLRVAFAAHGSRRGEHRDPPALRRGAPGDRSRAGRVADPRGPPAARRRPRGRRRVRVAADPARRARARRSSSRSAKSVGMHAGAPPGRTGIRCRRASSRRCRSSGRVGATTRRRRSRFWLGPVPNRADAGRRSAREERSTSVWRWWRAGLAVYMRARVGAALLRSAGRGLPADRRSRAGEYRARVAPGDAERRRSARSPRSTRSVVGEAIQKRQPLDRSGLIGISLAAVRTATVVAIARAARRRTDEAARKEKGCHG